MAELKPDRRRFLVRLMGVLGGIALLEAGWVAIVNFMPGSRGRKLRDKPSMFVAGSVDRFAPGSVTPFAQGKFYLVRDEGGGFLALHRKCTHLGCSVPWREDEQRFACPCHASAFNIHGEVVNAPAPRPLDLFPVTISNGVVQVDTSEPIRRAAFEPDQLVRA